MHRVTRTMALSQVLGFFASLSWASTLSAGELHDAVHANDRATLEALLEDGADVDESDFLLGTALHAARTFGT